VDSHDTEGVGSHKFAEGETLNGSRPGEQADSALSEEKAVSEEEIQAWLVAQLSDVLEVETGDIDIREPFDSYGLSSKDAVVLAGDLEVWLNRRLSPTLVYEYPTIEALARYLAYGPGDTQAIAAPGVEVGVEQRWGKDREPIAIIGIGCRFPGADNPAAFWKLLLDGTDAITEVPTQRWDVPSLYDPDPTVPGKMSTRWGGFLKEVELFDPFFFGISPREATRMDPQQRLLLEVAWEALEDAGQVPETLAGTLTGVFVGISSSDYGQLQFSDPRLSDAYAGTGNALSISANRISYVFGFRGPSMAVDTACSSSLVAIHLACQSLWNGESTIALAGGVNLILAPAITINFSKAGFMAPDGRCKAFDAGANGYVRGEGAGVVVLKPLSKALADGERIYAVIRGSAVNQDGRSNGLTAPNRQAQEMVLREAYRQAGVSPGRVRYVEAHGTGTHLGDPIEAGALGAVLATDRPPGERCAIGSVKTNIGHLEAAAGIAGLIKVALALKNRAIPPSLHFKEPNPHIPFDELPLYVQQSLASWPEESHPAIAGVSSFGFGGTNAHVVLEEAPSAEQQVIGMADNLPSTATASEGEGRTYLLPLSARTPQALLALARSYLLWLSPSPLDAPDVPDISDLPRVGDICYTASVRRSHHDYRLPLVGSSHSELAARLSSFLQDAEQTQGEHQEEQVPPGTARRRKPGQVVQRPVFVFSGQGTQWVGMGRQLLRHQPVFRDVIEQCAALLRQYVPWSLLHILDPASASEQMDLDMSNTEIGQPVVFAVQVALAALWRSWGIEPGGVVAAAHVAGVLSLPDAVRVIYHRGRLMQKTTGQGAMAAVELPHHHVLLALSRYGYANVNDHQPPQEQEHSKRIRGNGHIGTGESISSIEAQAEVKVKVEIAAINSPTATVVSGEVEAVNTVVRRLKEEGAVARLLDVPYAFHSVQMEPYQQELVHALQGIQVHPPSIPIFSTVTGSSSITPTTPQGEEYWGEEYWGRNMREEVRFAQAIGEMVRGGYDTFIEISPHPVLGRAVEQCCQGEGVAGTIIASMRKGKDDEGVVLEGVGKLYSAGYPIEWERLYPPPAACVTLPTYPWQRQRYWIQTAPRMQLAIAGDSAESLSLHPLLGRRLLSPVIKDVVFESFLGTDSVPFLNDHRIDGSVVFPATAYIEMALAAAAKAYGAGPRVLKDVTFSHVLVPSESATSVQTVLAPSEAEPVSFQIFSRVMDNSAELPSWRLHAGGSVNDGSPDDRPPQRESDLEAARERCQEELSADAYYRKLREHGLEYGPSFRCIERLWRGDGEALGQVRLPEQETLEMETGVYQLHPALLDACFQTLGAALPGAGEEANRGNIYMPVGLDRLMFHGPTIGTELWCIARIATNNEAGDGDIAGNLLLLDEAGQLVAEVEGLRLKDLGSEAIGRAKRSGPDDWLYEVEWRLGPRSGDPATPTTQPRAQGTWLIFGGQEGVGDALTANLQQRGESCIIVSPGEAYERIAEPRYRVNPMEPEDFQRLFREVSADNGPRLRGVVHLWALETTMQEHAAEEGSDEGLSQLEAAQELCCGSVLHLAQAMVSREASGQPRLWLVTRGAQPVEAGPVAMSQAPLWGLGNVLALEHPELRCVRVDLDPASEADDTQELLGEVWSPDQEDRVAFRRNLRYVARLVHRASNTSLHGEGPQSRGVQSFRLEIPTPGILDNLTLQPVPRPQPGRGQVEIRVHATGMNFRDVLIALGMYPGDPVPLGGECAGTITALGEGVEGFQVGDEVVAITPGSFSTFVVIGADLVAPKPTHLSFEEAATIPIAFLTAHYGLRLKARISPGDRVLIHAAAGGVGTAAVHLALQAGAEVFATAGNDEKRQFLKSLGVRHIMNSRSLDFADEIMADTGGEGVDIVLNSLSGDYIPRSLSVLKAGGRYVEIGKIGIWSEIQVAQVKADISYFIIDMAETIREEPSVAGSLLRAIVEEFTQGHLNPLPLKVFPMEDVASAFRYMAQAKHIGKVVVSQQQAMPGAAPGQQGTLRDDATYLITGGLGALGLLVARWMVERGARQLVLIGRGGAHVTTAARETLHELEEAGARVVIAQADVSQREQVESVLAEAGKHMPPLRGVIHLAGVLDDGVLLQQTWPRFAKVMAPKIAGAWNLHVLTQHTPLDFFVLFSSVASLIGSPGQGNYSAANAFLDALAFHRRAQRLPAVSINWGPWAGDGMTSAAGGGGKRKWTSLGMGTIAAEEGLQALGGLLRESSPQVAVLPTDWPVFLQEFPGGSAPPLLADMARESQLEPGAARLPDEKPEFLRQLEEAPAIKRRSLLTAHIREQVVRVLGLQPSYPLDPAQPLSELGLDSLMAVELRNRLQTNLGHTLPATIYFDYPTIESVSSYLATQVLSLEEPPVDSTAEAHEEDKGNGGRARMSAELEQLSEEQMLALLTEKLAGFSKRESK
jgi:acyl transferase domain-containing protein/acyl carrier protein